MGDVMTSGDTYAGATFSYDRVYRYSLWRRWAPGGSVLWVLLNPSTADEHNLDPTLRRCFHFTQQWGFTGLWVANLYALRSKTPEDLWKVPDPVGPCNDDIIEELRRRADLVVCGWGNNARTQRVDEVLRLLGEDVYALRVTVKGQPEHPLYLPTRLEPYRLEAREKGRWSR